MTYRRQEALEAEHVKELFLQGGEAVEADHGPSPTAGAAIDQRHFLDLERVDRIFTMLMSMPC